MNFFGLNYLCYSLFIFPPIFCCSLSIDNLDSGSKLCVMYSIEPYFRGTKRCLFIWSMSLGAPSTNCCRSMEPLGSLLFRIIRGRYFLVLPIYMEETPCIGDASTTCLFVITEPIIWTNFLKWFQLFCRDIKGANILVGPNGEVKLADFGMAKHVCIDFYFLFFKISFLDYKILIFPIKNWSFIY